jgi:hypothetical protein
MTDIENETRFQQWNERIQAICKDVQGLVIGRFIYKAVQSIVEANDALHHPSAFYDLSASTYAGWAAMGVRRHVDADPDSVSLVNLLDSVAQHPATLSLERFLAPYRAASVFRPKVLEEIGDEYLGRGATQIDPESVRHDILISP